MDLGHSKVPPHSEEAERAVIGAILLDPTCLDSLSDLHEDEFYREGHRITYRTIRELHEANIPIDLVTLQVRLREQDRLTRAGGVQYLARLLDECPTAANVRHYAETVKKNSRYRQVINSCSEAIDDMFEELHADDGIKKLVQRLGTLELPKRIPDTIFKSGPAVLDLYRRVKAGYTGVQYPWETLNRATMGIWPGTMIMFVARPGIGKTMVAMICTRHAWLDKKRVLMVSPEMSKEELAERFFVMESGASYLNVVQGTLSDFEFKGLEDTVKKHVDDTGYWIIDNDDDLSPSGVQAAIRAVEPDVVGMDSMYLMPGKGNDQDRMELWLDNMRLWARHYKFAGIGFGQQNRIAELAEKMGGGHRLGTIAMTDKIARDPYAVYALVQDKDMRHDKVMKIIPLKIRRGFLGGDAIEVRWDFESMNFSELNRGEDEEFKDDEFDESDVPF